MHVPFFSKIPAFFKAYLGFNAASKIQQITQIDVSIAHRVLPVTHGNHAFSQLQLLDRLVYVLQVSFGVQNALLKKIFLPTVYIQLSRENPNPLF
jgi:hypothetical protein